MDLALEQARNAANRGEIPVGAVLVHQGKILAQNGNRMRETFDPTAHAEINVLRQGAKLLKNERLPDCDLYVTLEPCAMCAGAISHSRIRRLYFAAGDAKGGAVEYGPRWFSQTTCFHRPEIYAGIGEAEAQKLLQEFFRAKR